MVKTQRGQCRPIKRQQFKAVRSTTLGHHCQTILSGHCRSERLQAWQLTALGVPLVLLKEPELMNHQAIECQLCLIDHCIGFYVTP